MNSQKQILIHVSRKEVLSFFAKNAVSQSPYECPENLEAAVCQMSALLKSLFGEKHFVEISYEGMRDEIVRCINECPLALEWNSPKSGHTAGMVFVSRFDEPAQDDDFIDLGALARNIVNDLFFAQFDSHSIPDILDGKVSNRFKS